MKSRKLHGEKTTEKRWRDTRGRESEECVPRHNDYQWSLGKGWHGNGQNGECVYVCGRTQL